MLVRIMPQIVHGIFVMGLPRVMAYPADGAGAAPWRRDAEREVPNVVFLQETTSCLAALPVSNPPFCDGLDCQPRGKAVCGI